MSVLFETTSINGMALKNRMVRSATWEGMCDREGRPTEKLFTCFENLAKGGVGLIITGYVFVRPDGRQLPGTMGLHTDDLGDTVRALTARVHDNGGLICAQLVHCGGQASSAAAGRLPLAPSAVQVAQFSEVPEALSRTEIHAIADAFGEAARRAKLFGFDAVQLHAAHGYLINEFLSPLTNRREDEYGGSVENRCRFLLEVYGRVRGAVGPAYPVLVKLNGSDFLEGGLTLDDALLAARALDDQGVDGIEVSGGTPASGEQSPVRQKIDERSKEAYNRQLAKAVKHAVRCPVMVVGGVRSFEVAEDIVRSGDADYVSFARPLIREPELPRRWQEGNRGVARCISCNGCFKPGLKEGGIYCVVEKIEREGKRSAL